MRKLALAVCLALTAPTTAVAVVPSTLSRYDTTGNGVTTVFTFSFKVSSSLHVEVYLGGVKQVAGYVVALNANQELSPGGTVTFVVAPANGLTVRIQRTVPLTQETVYTPYSAFPAKTTEKALDRTVQQAQQLDRKIDDYIAQAQAAAAVPSSMTPIVPEGGNTAATLGHWLAEAVNVKGSGAKCNGIDDDGPALIAAQVAAVGGKTLLVTCKLRLLSAAGTISAPIRFEGGGSLDLQPGGSVTLSGPLDAPLARIFWANGGTVAFAGKVPAFFYPQWWGAVGDGVADETAAIRAAMYAGGSAANVFFLPGTYLVTSPIDLDGSPRFGWWHIEGAGPVLSKITGNFADFVIKRSLSVGTSGGDHIIRGLSIINTSASASAGGVKLTDAVGSRIERLEVTIANGVGIDVATNNFTTIIDGVNVTGTAFAGIGIQGKNHVTIIGPDVRGLSEGVRVAGVGSNVMGGRFEINRTGLMIGKDPTGATYALAGAQVLGNRFEANDTDIDVVSCNGCTIAGVSTQGSVGSPSAQSIYGVIVRGAVGSSFKDFVIGGGYSKSAFYVPNPSPNALTSTTFQGVTVGNSLSPGTVGAKRWDFGGGVTDEVAFVASRPDLSGTDPTNIPGSVFGTAAVGGLSAVDHLTGTVASRNLRGKNLPVGAAAVSVGVIFPATHSSGNGINTVVAAGGGTLAAGTYYYVMTFVNALGESSSGVAEKTVTVDGATTTAATISFFGIGDPDAWRRRVYRGRSAGDYDGYYDLPLNSSADFTDTGATFTGRKSPPLVGVTLPSGAEPDTNYSVVCTPQWNATCWVTAKATTGFTLNFSVAPGGGGSFVDWHLIR